MSKDGDFSDVSYVLGILSIAFAFFQPVAALIIGIVGIVQSRKQKTPLSARAKKLSFIGIVLSIIFFIITVALTAYFTLKGLKSPLP
jgi:predicted membrane protein